MERYCQKIIASVRQDEIVAAAGKILPPGTTIETAWNREADVFPHDYAALCMDAEQPGERLKYYLKVLAEMNPKEWGTETHVSVHNFFIRLSDIIKRKYFPLIDAFIQWIDNTFPNIPVVTFRGGMESVEHAFRAKGRRVLPLWITARILEQYTPRDDVIQKHFIERGVTIDLIAREADRLLIADTGLQGRAIKFAYEVLRESVDSDEAAVRRVEERVFGRLMCGYPETYGPPLYSLYPRLFTLLTPQGGQMVEFERFPRSSKSATHLVQIGGHTEPIHIVWKNDAKYLIDYPDARTALDAWCMNVLVIRHFLGQTA